MNKRVKLSKFWPILEPKDICIGNFQIGGSRCLLGWISWLFTTEKINTNDYDKIREEIEGIIGHSCILIWNDAHTPQECADVWNEVGRRLDYDIDNPIDW